MHGRTMLARVVTDLKFGTSVGHRFGRSPMQVARAQGISSVPKPPHVTEGTRLRENPAKEPYWPQDRYLMSPSAHL